MEIMGQMVQRRVHLIPRGSSLHHLVLWDPIMFLLGRVPAAQMEMLAAAAAAAAARAEVLDAVAHFRVIQVLQVALEVREEMAACLALGAMEEEDPLAYIYRARELELYFQVK